MLVVRFWGAVIAVFLLVNAGLARHDDIGVIVALVPSVVAAAAMLALAWRDACTRLQRQLVAAGAGFLAGGIALSLLCALFLASGAQPVLLAGLLAAALPLAARAVWLSRRVPRARGFAAYYSR